MPVSAAEATGISRAEAASVSVKTLTGDFKTLMRKAKAVGIARTCIATKWPSMVPCQTGSPGVQFETRLCGLPGSHPCR